MTYSQYNEQVQNWMKQVKENRGVNAERTLQGCRRIEEYALQLDDKMLLGFSYYYMGETYYILNDIENLFHYMTKALGCLEKTEQWDLAARTYNILAITSINRGNAPFAMDYYLNGISYCQKYHMIEVHTIININIASLYINYGEYIEAQHYLEQAYTMVDQGQKTDAYYTYLSVIYISLAKCYLKRNLIDKAQEYWERTVQECGTQLELSELLYMETFQARLLHAQGNAIERDVCIAKISEQLTQNFTLLDMFDEYYDYAEMLLEIDKYDEFWELIQILEELTKQAKIINLQRQLLSLKIRYYKKTRDNAGYLQAAGLYYELSEVMEKENRYMVSTMLTLRRTLSRETKMRQEVERENELLMLQSETDALTGLFNRQALNKYAEEKFTLAMESHRSLAIEIMDIDFFKNFNDSYGHQAGDVCLKKVAEEIKNMENNGAITGFRYGGDEFIIIYEGFSKESVLQLAESLKKKISGLVVALDDERVLPTITLSQGICWGIPDRKNKVWDFLHAADENLYKVKKDNRDDICINE